MFKGFFTKQRLCRGWIVGWMVWWFWTLLRSQSKGNAFTTVEWVSLSTESFCLIVSLGCGSRPYFPFSGLELSFQSDTAEVLTHGHLTHLQCWCGLFPTDLLIPVKAVEVLPHRSFWTLCAGPMFESMPIHRPGISEAALDPCQSAARRRRRCVGLFIVSFRKSPSRPHRIEWSS